MAYLSDQFGKFFVATVAGALVFGLSSLAHNSIVDEDRADLAKTAAGKACIVKGDNPSLVEKLRVQCNIAAQNAINQKQRSFDNSTFWFSTDKDGNKAFADTMTHIQKDIPAYAAFEYKKWTSPENQRVAIAKNINKIVVNNERPFADAKIDVDLQSIVPVIRGDGANLGYTGNFVISITDAGSTTVSGKYEYNSKNGIITQVLGANKPQSFWSGGNPAFIAGLSNKEIFPDNGVFTDGTKLPEHCWNPAFVACAVTSEVIKTLNTLPRDEVEQLRATLQAMANQNQGNSEPFKMNDTLYQVDAMKL